MPAAVRGAIDRVAGAETKSAHRAWGGFTPSATFHLSLSDGRTAFVKAIGPGATPLMREQHERETALYRLRDARLDPWRPELLGHAKAGAWQILLLEDVPDTPMPASPERAQRLFGQIARFAEATRHLHPGWLPELPAFTGTELSAAWLLESQPDALRPAFASECAAEAADWVFRHRKRLARAVPRLLDRSAPRQLLHGDLRSDNILSRDGRLCLVDWGNAVNGPAELDLALFALSAVDDYRIGAEQAVAWYRASGPVEDALLDASACALFGFYLEQARRPELPQLPRLRRFQKRQMLVCLGWIVERLALERQCWLDAELAHGMPRPRVRAADGSAGAGARHILAAHDPPPSEGEA